MHSATFRRVLSTLKRYEGGVTLLGCRRAGLRVVLLCMSNGTTRITLRFCKEQEWVLAHWAALHGFTRTEAIRQFLFRVLPDPPAAPPEPPPGSGGVAHVRIGRELLGQVDRQALRWKMKRPDTMRAMLWVISEAIWNESPTRRLAADTPLPN